MREAVGYLCLGGGEQMNGDGLPRQRAAIEAHAITAGYQIVKWYEEQGVSGAVACADRPVWYELALDAKERNYVIIIEKLDQLTRDLVWQETILRDLFNAGLTLVSATESFITSIDPSRLLMRGIIGRISEFDKLQLVSKLKLARERTKKEKGRCEGTKPYGTFKGEAEVLSQILTMARAGLGYSAIARALNERGTTTRYAKQWYPYTISTILARVDGRKPSGGVEVVRRRRKRTGN